MSADQVPVNPTPVRESLFSRLFGPSVFFLFGVGMLVWSRYTPDVPAAIGMAIFFFTLGAFLWTSYIFCDYKWAGEKRPYDPDEVRHYQNKYIVFTWALYAVTSVVLIVALCFLACRIFFMSCYSWWAWLWFGVTIFFSWAYAAGHWLQVKEEYLE